MRKKVRNVWFSDVFKGIKMDYWGKKGFLMVLKDMFSQSILKYRVSSNKVSCFPQIKYRVSWVVTWKSTFDKGVSILPYDSIVSQIGLFVSVNRGFCLRCWDFLREMIRNINFSLYLCNYHSKSSQIPYYITYIAVYGTVLPYNIFMPFVMELW